MSYSKFEIIEHISPCQHIRGFPHSVKSEDAILQLAVKEYRPLRTIADDDEAVTIIAAHCIGFPKVGTNQLGFTTHEFCEF